MRLAALNGPRVPDRHLFQRYAHFIASVAAKVLIRQEEKTLAAGEGPLEGGAGVGRGADQSAALAAEGLDGGGRVHVGQRQGFVREAEALKRLPAGFDLRDFGHVGH
jgi:hypothetical protein